MRILESIGIMERRSVMLTSFGERCEEKSFFYYYIHNISLYVSS